MKKGMVSVLSTLAGAAIGAGTAGTVKEKEVQKWKDYSNKHLALYKMMCQWVTVKQDGTNLAEYFEQNGYKRIAIYGMSFAGDTLAHELRDTGIQVVYGIDQNAATLYADFDIVTMEDKLEEVDVVVVTAITFFDAIAEELSAKINCPIVSLEDVLYEI
ncbi:MAG: hypothetical protein J1F18_04925 [Lachnospiraceae bacterium]|nr:hypothetical protein [Lachnospiraceae bacterium]